MMVHKDFFEILGILAADGTLGAKAQIIRVLIVADKTKIAILLDIGRDRELEPLLEVFNAAAGLGAVRVAVGTGELINAEELLIPASGDFIPSGIDKQAACKGGLIVPDAVLESTGGKVEC